MTLQELLADRYDVAELIEALYRVRLIADRLDRVGDPEYSRIARDIHREVDAAIGPRGE